MTLTSNQIKELREFEKPIFVFRFFDMKFFDPIFGLFRVYDTRRAAANSVIFK